MTSSRYPPYNGSRNGSRERTSTQGLLSDASRLVHRQRLRPCLWRFLRPACRAIPIPFRQHRVLQKLPLRPPQPRRLRNLLHLSDDGPPLPARNTRKSTRPSRLGFSARRKTHSPVQKTPSPPPPPSPPQHPPALLCRRRRLRPLTRRPTQPALHLDLDSRPGASNPPRDLHPANHHQPHLVHLLGPTLGGLRPSPARLPQLPPSKSRRPQPIQHAPALQVHRRLRAGIRQDRHHLHGVRHRLRRSPVLPVPLVLRPLGRAKMLPRRDAFISFGLPPHALYSTNRRHAHALRRLLHAVSDQRRGGYYRVPMHHYPSHQLCFIFEDTGNAKWLCDDVFRFREGGWPRGGRSDFLLGCDGTRLYHCSLVVFGCRGGGRGGAELVYRGRRGADEEFGDGF